MLWPSVTAIAGELRLLNENTLGEFEVFLQVLDDGNWVIWTSGGSDGGTMRHLPPGEIHQGYWSWGHTLPGVGGRNNMPRRFNAREVARQLIVSAQQREGTPASPSSAEIRQRIPRRKKQPVQHTFFIQAGTDDYAPETQRFYPQFYSSDRLNGLGGGEESPSWQHDCDRCVFLGKYDRHEGDGFDGDYDLYFCSDSYGFHTVLARYGSEGSEYRSFSVDRNTADLFRRKPTHPLAVAYERAKAMGFDFSKALSGLNGLEGKRGRDPLPKTEGLYDGEGITLVDGYPHRWAFEARPIRRLRRTHFGFGFEVFVEEENQWMLVGSESAPTKSMVRTPTNLNGLGLGPYRPRPEPPTQPHACPVCNIDMLFPHDICPTCSRDEALVYAVPRTWSDDQLPPRHELRKKARRPRTQGEREEWGWAQTQLSPEERAQIDASASPVPVTTTTPTRRVRTPRRRRRR